MHIFTAHAQKRLFRSFRSKIWPRHSLRRHRFPIRQMHFHYRVTFTRYIWCFCVTTSHDNFDVALWPLDLESVSCTALLVSDPHTNFYYPMTIGYWVTSTKYLITFSLSKTITAHVRVTWPLTGSKIVHIFEIPDPNLPIHFLTFTALRRRLSHVIGEK